MGVSRPTLVVFACLNCVRLYCSVRERLDGARPGRFDCVRCNAEIHARQGIF
jgi:hypothetical protein